MTLRGIALAAALAVLPNHGAAQTRAFIAMGFLDIANCSLAGCPVGRIIELDLDNLRVLADTPTPLATVNSWRQLHVTADGSYLLWSGSNGGGHYGMVAFDTASRTAAVAAPFQSRLQAHPRRVKAFVEDGLGNSIQVADGAGVRPLVNGCTGLHARSDDGARLLLSCGSHMRVVDSETGAELGRVPRSLDTPFASFAFTANGSAFFHTTLVPGGAAGTTRYERYDVASGSLLDAFSDGDYAGGLLGYPGSGAVHLDARTNRLFRGRLGAVRVLSAAPLAPIATLAGPAANSWPFLAFDPDAPRVFIAWETRLPDIDGQPQWRTTLQALDTETLQVLFDVSMVARTRVRALALAPRSPAPSALVATVDGSRVSLAWSTGTGTPTTGFVVEAGSASGLADLAVMRVPGTAFDVANVPAGRYFVRVRSVNALGPHAASNEVIVTVP